MNMSDNQNFQPSDHILGGQPIVEVWLAIGALAEGLLGPTRTLASLQDSSL